MSVMHACMREFKVWLAARCLKAAPTEAKMTKNEVPAAGASDRQQDSVLQLEQYYMQTI